MKPDLNELRKQRGNWGAVLAFRTTEAKERHGSRIVIRIISPDEWSEILEIWQMDEHSAPKKAVKYLFRDEAGIRRVALNERIEWADDYEAVRKVASKWKDSLNRNRRPAKIAYPSSWSRGIGAEVESTASSTGLIRDPMTSNLSVVDPFNPNQAGPVSDTSGAVIPEVKQSSPTTVSPPLYSSHFVPKSKVVPPNQLKSTEKKQGQALLKLGVVDAWVQILKRRLRL